MDLSCLFARTSCFFADIDCRFFQGIAIFTHTKRCLAEFGHGRALLPHLSLSLYSCFRYRVHTNIFYDTADDIADRFCDPERLSDLPMLPKYRTGRGITNDGAFAARTQKQEIKKED